MVRQCCCAYRRYNIHIRKCCSRYRRNMYGTVVMDIEGIQVVLLWILKVYKVVVQWIEKVLKVVFQWFKSSIRQCCFLYIFNILEYIFKKLTYILDYLTFSTKTNIKYHNKLGNLFARTSVTVFSGINCCCFLLPVVNLQLTLLQLQ